MTDIASLGIRVTSDGVAKAQTDLDKLATSGDRAAQATDRLSKANANAAKKYASPQYRQQADDLAKLVGQIDPTVAALDKLDRQQAKLAAFKKAGILSSDDFKTYSAAIDESRVKLTSASEAVHKFSLNNAMARRELGYLVKDLATGQYGRFQQSALTLANASGVMSLAFSGIGAAVATAVVALVAFTAAAFKGEQETSAFNKALILTGGYAGKTAGQLEDISRQIGALSGSQHEAAAALAEVASSGKFTADKIALVGQAAVDMAKLTGQGTDATIKQFEELQQKPLEAVLKLNEAQHFLTESTYEQIKALEDQGRVQDAATLAQKTYAQAVADRAKDVKQNLGTLERAWGGVAGAAKAAWDAMLNVGREDTASQRLQSLQDMRKRLQDKSFFSFSDLSDADRQKRIADIDKQISAIYDAAEKAQKAAQQKSAKAQAVQAGAESDQDAAAYATNEQKRVKAILTARAKANDAIARAEEVGDKALADRIRANEKIIEAGIADQYKDPKGSTPRAKRAIDFTVQDANQIREEIAAEGRLMDQRLRSQAAVVSYRASLQDMLDTRQKAIDLQVASLGMGDKEIAQQQALIAIEDDYNRKKASLERQQRNSTSEIDRASYSAQLADLEAYHDKRVQIEMKGFERSDAARGSWEVGAKRAYANILDEASNVAGQTDNLFTNAFDSMANALADFATTGKLNFKGLVTSILADLAKMEIRIAASRILQSVLGSFAGGGQDYSGTTSAGGGFTYNMPTYNANGGVYSSPSLSTYSGQIVTQPTMFAFAKGAGIMGEAGPEAILPLSRGADGKLGVKAGGSGGDVNISQTFVIDSNGSASGQTSGNGDDSVRQLASRMKSVAQQTILDEQRPGGSLWRMGQRA